MRVVLLIKVGTIIQILSIYSEQPKNDMVK